MQLIGSYKNQPFKPPQKSANVPGVKYAPVAKNGPVVKHAPVAKKAPVVRNVAPPKTIYGYTKSAAPKTSASSTNEPATPPSHDSSKKYCSLMYRKYTTKKNKTWDGDAYGIYISDSRNLMVYSIEGRYLGSKSIPTSLNDTMIISFNNLEYQLDYFIEPSMKSEYQHVRETLSPNVPMINQTISHNKRSAPVEDEHSDPVSSQEPAISQEPVKKVRVNSHFTSPMLIKPLNSLSNSFSTSSASAANRSSKSSKILNPLHDPTKIANPLIMNKCQTESPGEYSTDVVVDPLISNLLRPHQREGVKFMYDCIMGVKSPDISGCLLADEMGLGKTLMTITIIWTLLKQTPNPKQISQRGLVSLNGEIKKIMIVCPVTLISNWKKEFKKWIGLQKIGILTLNNPKNGTDKDKSDFQNFLKVQRTYQVIIMSYEKVISLQNIFNDMDVNQYVDLLICDEAHRLKNNNSKILQTLKTCDFKKKILLTGTPIQNDLNEFFTIIDFLNPGIMGNINSFKKNYSTPISRSREINNRSNEKVMELGNERSAELIDITSQFILRRTNDILNKYLPPKLDYIVFCKPTKQQVEISNNILAENNINFDKMSFNSSLGLITLFKKICNSPSLIHSDTYYNSEKLSLKSNLNISTENSGKLRVFNQILQKIKRTSNDKIVIISNYTQTLDIIENVLRGHQLSFLRLDGSTATKVRNYNVQEFNSNPMIRCFLLSAKSGGVGLNLIGGNRLILFDNDWNPAIDAQAMGRIHRDGQKKTCYIYRLVTTGLIDEKILQRQLMKINLSKQILDDAAQEEDEQVGTTKKSKEHNSNIFEQTDLKDLFTIRTDTKSNTHDLICPCIGDYHEVGDFNERDAQIQEIKLESGFMNGNRAQEQIENQFKKSEVENKILIQQCFKGYKHVDPNLKDSYGNFFREKLKDTVLKSVTDTSISFILEK